MQSNIFETVKQEAEGFYDNCKEQGIAHFPRMLRVFTAALEVDSLELLNELITKTMTTLWDILCDDRAKSCELECAILYMQKLLDSIPYSVNAITNNLEMFRNICFEYEDAMARAGKSAADRRAILQVLHTYHRWNLANVQLIQLENFGEKVGFYVIGAPVRKKIDGPIRGGRGRARPICLIDGSCVWAMGKAQMPHLP